MCSVGMQGMYAGAGASSSCRKPAASLAASPAARLRVRASRGESGEGAHHGRLCMRRDAVHPRVRVRAGLQSDKGGAVRRGDLQPRGAVHELFNGENFMRIEESDSERCKSKCFAELPMPVRGADGNVVMLPLQLGVFEVNQQGGGAVPVRTAAAGSYELTSRLRWASAAGDATDQVATKQLNSIFAEAPERDVAIFRDTQTRRVAFNSTLKTNKLGRLDCVKALHTEMTNGTVIHHATIRYTPAGKKGELCTVPPVWSLVLRMLAHASDAHVWCNVCRAGCGGA